MLMRQVATPTQRPTIQSSGSGRTSDEVVVTMSDGSRYRVTRLPDPDHATVRRHGMPHLGVGSDADRVWMNVSWCRGTRGEIRVGGNPQGAARDLLQTISQQIANGQGADTVVQSIKDASIQPFTSVEVASSGSWKITGEVTITVNRTGVTGGSGSVNVDTGPVQLGADVSVGQGGNVTFTVTGTFTPGRHAPEHTCTPDELEIPYRYECVHDTDVPAHPEVQHQPYDIDEDELHYVYFHYADKEINHELSDRELESLSGSLREGFQVTTVQGRTSPEGLRTPGRGRFEGNDELANERAQAAIRELQSRCDGCTASTGSISSPSELYSPPDVGPAGRQREAEGTELERYAVEHFLTEDAELPHRTPELVARIGRARGWHAKAEIVYPYLRRAEIRLHRSRHLTRDVTVIVPAGTTSERGSCPDDVMATARGQFRLQDSLSGRGPFAPH